MIRPPPRSTLFPYPPLSRSVTDTSQIAPADPAAGGGPRTGSLSALRLPELQAVAAPLGISGTARVDRKSTRLNSSHANISYAVFCLKKKKYRQLLAGHDNAD